MKAKDPSLITVCIPAYKETKIIDTLAAVAKCDTVGLNIRVSILVNGSKKDDLATQKVNETSFLETQQWIKKYKGPIDFHLIINLELPQKHAGVGLARKILGDKAALDFKTAGKNGIIAYLDADSTVAENYFQEISGYFHKTNHTAASIRFEHQINNAEAQRGIIEYEAHLRYFRLMQEHLALPFAFHTVGSSMAVLAKAYLAKGGMNKRKAGEDFYFLHKFIKDNECGNLSTTKVLPSGRTSDRVPFGTGRAMLNYEEEDFYWPTYNPLSFLFLKPFLAQIDQFYLAEPDFSQLHEGLNAFLKTLNAAEKLVEMKGHVATLPAFRKRFFQFFDAFQLMKYLHFMRDEYSIEDIPVAEALKWYAEHILNTKDPENMLKGLMMLREVDV